MSCISYFTFRILPNGRLKQQCPNIGGAANAHTIYVYRRCRIVTTIRKIAAGETCISPDIQRQLEANPPIPKLSARQAEVLQMVVDGKTSKEIASVLGIRPDSVDAVTRALFEKMNVSSRTEAVAIALRKQLVKI